MQAAEAGIDLSKVDIDSLISPQERQNIMDSILKPPSSRPSSSGKTLNPKPCPQGGPSSPMCRVWSETARTRNPELGAVLRFGSALAMDFKPYVGLKLCTRSQLPKASCSS